MDRNVTVSVSNMALKEVLPLVFGKDYRFEVEENVVIVRPFVAVTGDGQRGGFVVRGVVTDTKRQPLPGVTVKVANTTVGTATNNAGQSCCVCRSRREVWSFLLSGLNLKT